MYVLEHSPGCWVKSCNIAKEMRVRWQHVAVTALGGMAEMNITVANRGKYRCGSCLDEAVCESAEKCTFTALTNGHILS